VFNLARFVKGEKIKIMNSGGYHPSSHPMDPPLCGTLLANHQCWNTEAVTYFMARLQKINALLIIDITIAKR